MNFNSISFIFIFIPACLLIFYLASPRLRLPVLFLFSMVFYGASGISPGLLLFISIVIGYFGARLCQPSRNVGRLFFAISFPLLALFVSKYLGFSLTTVGVELQPGAFLDVIVRLSLPAGISFYTFQLVAYMIDIRDGKIERENNFIQFGTFIALFPQLIAGPILRYTEIRSQLRRIASEQDLRPDLMSGIKYCAFGLAYKIFFSDILVTMQVVYTNSEGAPSIDALYSVLAYSAIIYFDFWAYSLIAMGLAKLFTLDLPRNFREPYRSLSPREFWKRWHITLSFWLRDYVYFKMGGKEKYIRNIIVIFGLVGLWHGAGWNFILWGFYHAFWVLLYHFCKRWWDPLPLLFQIILTFVIVSLGWPLFYLDMNGYVQLLINLFSFTGAEGGSVYGLLDWAYLGVTLGWIFLVKEDFILFNNKRNFFDNPIFLACLLVGAIIFLSFARTFIYFQF
ncbi:MAG: hypothetical protein CMM32_06800 [Rhodospirillaceae bacterium]|nr:hypothetical protein [Rhodospirillaceae bacterium]